MLKIFRASAGSGKTHRLTGEFIRLLFSKDNERTYRRILAVTFTNKATDEMKSRILKELHLLSIGAPSDYRADLMQLYKLSSEAVDHRARKILVAILHDYSSFSISTIDKFFQQVIRAFAREIGLQGGYNLELDSETTLQQSIDNLFLDLNKAENKQLLHWLTSYAEERIEQSENWNPRRNIESLGYEIFKESYQNKAEETNRKLHDREFLTSYRAKLRKTQVDFELQVKTLAQQTLSIITDAGLTPDSFKGGSRSPVQWLPKFAAGRFELKDTFIVLADEVGNCYGKTTPKSVIAAIEGIYHAGFQQNIIHIIELLQKDIIFYNSAGIILKYINTLGILSDLAMQIKKLTDEQNTMLISDTNMLLNRIIDNSDTPFVYEKTGITINHFMIDEFQDTSTLQWKNFLPLITNSLASDQLNLVVGDVKQSIYRWRNSDWKLLDENVMHDFRPEQLEEISLDTNWRSDKNIIAFNNEFFKEAAVLLQHKLNTTIHTALPLYPELKKHTERILHAYGHLFQKASPKAGVGQVKFCFLERDENEDGWKAESLKRLPALLEDLQERGYKPCDVAILVKKNSEASAVIQTLLSYKMSDDALAHCSYNVMGSEGLLIASAAAVRFITALLKTMLRENDAVNRTILNYEYALASLKLSSDEALKASFSSTAVEGSFSHLFTDDQNAALARIKNSSVYELVENVISIFNLGSWYNESAFVQGFQDVVYKYSNGKNTDIHSFIKWWDKTGYKQSIATPENVDAFRVMTIHKSKGLDFKAVVMPFCDWDLSQKNSFNKNFLWTEPAHAPFNELPLLPVEFSSKLAQSIFAPQYFDELMHQLIDNLNVAYVAFTRAKHELICFAPKPEKEPETVEKISKLSELLYLLFGSSEFKSELFAQSFDASLNQLCVGEPKFIEKSTEPINANSQTTIAYRSCSPTGRLRLRNLCNDSWLESQEITQSALQLGNVMHEILQNIRVKSDAEKAVFACIADGKINDSEAQLVRAMLEQFWLMPETNQWFDPMNKVLNEAVILVPNSKLYRPDRVVINGNTATVIDYKFGEVEKQSYVKQVQNYKSLIAEMGYEVKSFLCYVSLNRVVEVE